GILNWRATATTAWTSSTLDGWTTALGQWLSQPGKLYGSRNSADCSAVRTASSPTADVNARSALLKSPADSPGGKTASSSEMLTGRSYHAKADSTRVLWRRGMARRSRRVAWGLAALVGRENRSHQDERDVHDDRGNQPLAGDWRVRRQPARRRGPRAWFPRAEQRAPAATA